MSIKKILFVLGTRPEAIKVAPLIKEFKNNKNFNVCVVSTGQHKEMLNQVIDFFNIQVDYELNLMTPNQSLNQLSGKILDSLKSVLDKEKPDYVFVHGDTTTTAFASIASFYNQIKICHIEAGLRTFNKYSPFPEEINRQVTSRISEYHFAPTEKSKFNLLKENIDSNSILVTGNTVIDALLQSIDKIKKNKNSTINYLEKKIDNCNEIILVTGHRRENHGLGFENICKALKKISIIKPNVKIIYPVHLNPKVKDPVNKYLGNLENILLIEPLDYQSFIWLMDRSKIIITDSGGVQEEAPSLGKPVLVLRDITERPEAVDAGTVILVGTDENLIIKETIDLLENKERFEKMSKLHNPYGDGKASERIVKFLKELKS